MSQLTDDQKTEIQNLMQSMKDSGATQEEIRNAVDAKLQEWGIRLPTPPEHPTNSTRDSPWMGQLTDDQKTEIQSLMQSMRDSGSTQQEIMDEVNAKLQAWGIQISTPPQHSTNSTQQPPWMSQLTDDQKTEIQNLTQSMKDSGATQEEIRDAMDAKLQEWGIELPTPPEHPTNSTHEAPWMSQLTDDQKTEIQSLMQSMRDSGSTQQEIRDAANAKLQEWGIQLPAPPEGPGQ
jgi:predicted nucleic acid-binding Zn ribbon protein